MRALNTRGASAPGLAAPESARRDNARGEPGASGGQAQGLSHREFTGWPATLHPDFLQALFSVAAAILARLLRAGGAR
ncbi:hypothetical protein MASR1M6_32150 [Rubrivivax sp.]